MHAQPQASRGLHTAKAQFDLAFYQTYVNLDFASEKAWLASLLAAVDELREDILTHMKALPKTSVEEAETA